MTINEAITEVDALKANMYGRAEKIRWLSRLDWRIYNEIIATHEYNDDEDEIEYEGYTEDDNETELLAAEPYDEMYVHWLSAQIDRSNMEYDSFNNSNAMFEAVFSAYRNFYNAEHLPVVIEKNYF